MKGISTVYPALTSYSNILLCPRLIRMLRACPIQSTSHPYNKGEALLLKLQSLFDTAANQGRHFLGLCSLLDDRGDGQITVSEFTHVIKMMNANGDKNSLLISEKELEMIQDMLPKPILVNKGKELFVDYKELHHEMQLFTPRFNHESSNSVVSARDKMSELNMSYGSTVVNQYASSNSGYTPMRGSSMNASMTLDHSQSYSNDRGFASGGSANYSMSPSGIALPSIPGSQNRPYSAPSNNAAAGLYDTPRTTSFLSTPLGHHVPKDSRTYQDKIRIVPDIYDKIIRHVVVRINHAITRLHNDQQTKNFQLESEFQYYASDLSSELAGFISLANFQHVLVNLVKISLSVSELHVLQTMFGRPEDDMIDYISFLATYLPQYLVSSPIDNNEKTLSKSTILVRCYPP